jgi:Amidohydrolase family
MRHVLIPAFLAFAALGAQERFLTPASGDTPIAMGTTHGERYNRLVIRNAMVISGRGTPGTNRAMPPEGPIDIVIENGTIVNMVPVDPVNSAGYGGAFQRVTGDRVIDATGMYVLPGLVEMHAHLPHDGGEMGARAADYAFRLYLGHGVTVVRDAGSDAGIQQLVVQRRQGAANQIVAPRLYLCLRWPQPLRHWDEGNTPEKARAMVHQFQQAGADCIKISKSPGQYPDVLRAAADEGKKLGMFTMVDLKVSETDAVVASTAGVRSIEHWYGVPDAALTGTQNFPPNYNYWDELDRFRYAGLLWSEADQHPERLSAVLDTLLKYHTNWDPTMSVYEDNRDLTKYLTAPFRETLVHPSSTDMPDSSSHGAYHREWKTSDEINWKRNYIIWMKWVREFHDRGGLLTAGSDNPEFGGLAYIRELELMQEAGLHPLDVFKVATTNAYQAIGVDTLWHLCGVRVGCAADLAVVNGNPVDNMKVLYGRGYGFYGTMPRDQIARHGGVRWTIKDGYVFDAQALLREAEWYVQQERVRLGVSSPARAGTQ